MGITCEIGIYKPEDGEFRPGDVVAGVIKYGFDKGTKFSKITVSLKGFGKVNIVVKGHKHSTEYEYSETYVDVDNVITNDKIDENIYFDEGMYETQFNFTLPPDIPPSLKFKTDQDGYKVKCFIKYYVRIKFKQPGLLKSTKRYKQDITVLSGVKPTLPMEPTICGERKVLVKIFSWNDRVINIKATIENCVIPTGGKIQFNCEVSNLTDITIKAIHPRLVEVYTFMNPRKLKVRQVHTEKVKDTNSKTGVIKSGATQDYEFEINVPVDKTSIENSKIVSRKYVVLIKVVLPVPHRNVLLEIPVQIGDIIREDGLIREVFEHKLDAPPTYSEAMAESTDDDIDDDDVYDTEKTYK